MSEKTETLIHWLDWSEGAFDRATRESKPILLDISAVWCHWCHRLDQDTYSLPDIAEYIDTNFIPIRVDTDKRPDINRRYNLGGWPTTAFLAPDGRLIGGGTYFPPDQMRQLLHDVKATWQKLRNQTAPDPPAQTETSSRELTLNIVDEIFGEVANNFDPIYGGFGSEPKFPQTEAQELALLKHHYTGNREILGIAVLTLNNAGRSGTYDKEMGGFFRYSTTRDWSVPHFEKMCEDNAKWLQLYLHAYQTTRDSFYAETANGILEYVNGWLSDQTRGCFYGSQDADEEYYKLTKTERLKRTAPYVDKHIYTSWNAMMISAYLDASYTLENHNLRDFAIKSLTRLLSLNFTESDGMYHFYNGQPELGNQLNDQLQTANALIHAYECTGERHFLNQSQQLLKFTSSRLRDPEVGGFLDTAVNADAPGFLRRPIKPLEENSAAARVLTKMYHLTSDPNYRKMAEEALKCFSNNYLSYGFMSADYALAVDSFINEPTMVRIVGNKDLPETIGLIAEAIRLYEPRKIIQVLNPEEDAKQIADDGFRSEGPPTAYICVGNACTAPITEPKQIVSEVQRMVTPQLGR
jgi:uncharacterized protein YyaL (SSP411 family)